MAAREAIKIISDRIRGELIATINALPIPAGDIRPEVAVIRDSFSDDDLDPDDYDAVVVDLSDNATPEARFGSQGGADVRVPILIRYISGEPDSAQARQRVAHGLRALLIVLNRIVGAVDNEVQLLVLDALAYTFAIADDGRGNLEGLIAFNAQMRDLRVQ